MAGPNQLDRRFAQSLVDIVAAELNKNVNITNGHGLIIASFSKERIGQIHEAAARMLKDGQPAEFAVTAEDVLNMSGVREGFNVPIRYEGHCVGVIGVTGDAAAAAPYARLAAKFTEAALDANARQEQLLRLFQEKRSLQTTLLGKIMTIQEEERRQISRELHDETSQMLTSILIGLRILAGKVADDDHRQAVLELRELAANTLDSVKNLALELRPMLLADFGLEVAVRRYIKRYEQQHAITVSLDICGLEDRRLAGQVELTIYRILQEALTNIAKHSAAGQVSIRLAQYDMQVVLEIFDNGGGFEVASRQDKSDCLGLYGMRERVLLLGGELDIQSAAGAGTRINVTIPSA